MLTERQEQCVDAYRSCNESEIDAARLVGIDVKSLCINLWRAHKKGISFSHQPIIFNLTGRSTLTDGDGNVKLVWNKERSTGIDIDSFTEFCNQHIPATTEQFPVVGTTNENLMLEWPIYDAHHGMLAWEEETGSDYDHKISRHLQIAAGKILYQSFGRVRKTVIILGGDNQTSDSRSMQTERSHHSLDTDTRFQKMAWCSFESAVSSVETAACFSDEVLVIVLSGNHDYHSAIHLTIQLHAYFRNVDNVTVDTSPEPHLWYSFGRNVFMATHGEIKEQRAASFALQRAIKKGYATNPEMQLYIRMGHLHRRGRKTPDMLTEEDGVIIERFPTLAAQEAYSVESGYTSVRATCANLFNRNYGGKCGGRDITLGEILERYPYKEAA